MNRLKKFVKTIGIFVYFGLFLGAHAGNAVTTTLVIGDKDTNHYGHGHSRNFTQVGMMLTANFTVFDTGPATSSVVGYDVDYNDEVKVELLGGASGYIPAGQNRKHTAPYKLPLGNLEPGDYAIEISQNLNPNWVWGVTDLIVQQGQPPALITIENFENGETLGYDLPLLTGTAQSDADIVIYVNGASTQWSVNDGRWRAFVSLREGTNHLALMTQRGGYLSFYLEYLPLVNDKTVRLVYLLGSDSTGNFDAPPGVANTLVDAIPRIRLAGRMIQSLSAEMIADKGLPRQTFSLLTAADQVPIVETEISPLSVDELRSMDGLQLWLHFVDLMRDIPDRENTIDLAIIADTHFDPSINAIVPLAHTALGALPLALFGGGSIHSWPTAVDEIESRYTDSRPTEPFLFPEFGRSDQYWSNATTSVGAAMHELGHTFGLPHPDPGNPANFMNRGFDYLSRAIVTFEPELGAIDPASDLMPRWDDSSIAILQNNPWFAAAGTTQDILPVSVDIKPGNRHNTVNPRKKGNIWVALLSDTTPESPFDPSSQIDMPTVKFGPDGAKVNRYKVRDVNRDGLGDLLLRFKIRKTGINCMGKEVTLIGRTFDGQHIKGKDSITTVGCKRK